MGETTQLVRAWLTYWHASKVVDSQGHRCASPQTQLRPTHSSHLPFPSHTKRRVSRMIGALSSEWDQHGAVRRPDCQPHRLPLSFPSGGREKTGLAHVPRQI